MQVVTGNVWCHYLLHTFACPLLILTDLSIKWWQVIYLSITSSCTHLITSSVDILKQTRHTDETEIKSISKKKKVSNIGCHRVSLELHFFHTRAFDCTNCNKDMVMVATKTQKPLVHPIYETWPEFSPPSCMYLAFLQDVDKFTNYIAVNSVIIWMWSLL
jgi:hypothetical protein